VKEELERRLGRVVTRHWPACELRNLGVRTCRSQGRETTSRRGCWCVYGPVRVIVAATAVLVSGEQRSRNVNLCRRGPSAAVASAAAWRRYCGARGIVLQSQSALLRVRWANVVMSGALEGDPLDRFFGKRISGATACRFLRAVGRGHLTRNGWVWFVRRR
jgi:hypothetical protein